MNRQSYRVIFSKVVGTFIAVAEIISTHGKSKSVIKNSIATIRAMSDTSSLRLAQLTILVAAICNPLAHTHAQMVAYKKGSAPRPAIDQAANGRALVHIVTPNATGLSHNRFDQFNVDEHGAILNNSATITKTQLGGYVEANPNLATGRSARVILNEVMSTNRSQLNGYLEVAGQRAEVIVANPNGISVGGGAGFINASRGMLTTGTPTFGGDGGLAAFRVRKGDITIDTGGSDSSGGFNSTGVAQLDLIARSVQVNGALWANKLNVIAGSNQVNYQDSGVQVIAGAGQGNRPTVGIDSLVLGGMYAQKIMLVGTEAGVGVRTLGDISASAGDVIINSHGKISLHGQTNASGQLHLRSDDDVRNAGTLYGKQSVTIASSGQVTNSGTLAALNDLTIESNRINSSGVLAAGINAAGQAKETGDLTLTSSGLITATGQNTAGSNIILTGSGINLANGNTSANGAATFTATSGDINHGGGTLEVTGNTTIVATGRINNDSGAISTNRLTTHSDSFSNIAGSLVQSGAENTTIETTDLFNNTRGSIRSNAQLLALQSGNFINDAGKLSHAGNGTLAITAGALDNIAGAIAGNGQVNINAASVNNQRGQIIANRSATLSVVGDVNNTQGIIQTAEAMSINANNINNNAGSITSLNEDGLILSANDTITNIAGTLTQTDNENSETGNIGSNGNTTLTATNLINDGTITSGRTLSAHIQQQLNNNGGRLAAANALQVQAAALSNRQGVFDALRVDANVDELNNNHGKINAEQLSLHATNLSNQQGSIAQFGTDDSVIDVSNTLNNSDQGFIQTNSADLTLTPEQLINDGGTISHAGAGTLAIKVHHGAGSMQNRTGNIGSNGTVVVTASDIQNQSGKLFGQGDVTVVTTAGALNNSDQGYVSGDHLTLTIAGDINNIAGKIEGFSGLDIDANNLNNAAGTIQNSGVSILNMQLRNNLENTRKNNVSGFIGSAGNVTINASDIDNSYGTFYSKKKFQLHADGALTNVSGVIQSDGTISAAASGTINNQHGRIEANGNDDENPDQATPSLSIAGSHINNTSGRIASSDSGSTNINSASYIANDAGTIGGNDDVILNAIYLSNTQQGQVIAAGDLDLHIAKNLNNTQGNLYTADNLTMQQDDAVFTNVQGNVSAAGNIQFNVASLDNTQGQIGSAEAAKLSGDDNAANNGAKNTAGDIALTSASHITNTNGTIGSAKNLRMQTRSLVGNGRIVAGQDATINMQNNFTFTANNVIHANRDFIFTTTGILTNTTNLESVGNLILTAENITNRYGAVINSGNGIANLNAINEVYNLGRIYGNDVAISANSLLNDGIPNTNQAGVIAARNDMDLGAKFVVNNEQAVIQSLGNMSIGGASDANHHASGKASYLENTSATIDAGGDLNIQTAKLENANVHFVTALVDDPSLTLDGIVEYQVEGSPHIYKKNEVRFGEDDDGGRVMILPDGSRVERFYERVYKQTGQKTIITHSKPALIQAGGNLTLSGADLRNNQSVILAGGTLGGDIANLINTDAKGVVNITQTGIQKYYYLESCGIFGGDHCNRDDGGKDFARALPSSTVSLNIWQVQENTNPQHQTNEAIDAGVDNSHVPAGNAGSAGSLDTLDSNQQGQQLSGDGQVVDSTTGSAGGNTVISGSPQTIGSVETPIPNLVLPNSQLFPISTNPSATYVIETDPKFTNYQAFLSSDYLLSRLSLNAQQIQKRLGDGFYEQKLINDQITQLTGKRFLGDFTTNEQQYQALMKSGITTAEQFQLTPGIALTASQMAALTSDMVWLVSQEIKMPDGSINKVLVPIVYLAKVDSTNVQPTGSIISARNIDLTVNGNLQNDGTLQAGNNALIHATNITNTGTLRSDAANGTTVLVADNDVINSSGNISGKRVGILAGRDAIIKTSTIAATGVNGTNIGLDRVATVNAGQLNIQGGRDVTLSAALVTTTGDTSLVAGRNLTLASATTRNELTITRDDQNHLNQSQTSINGTQIQSKGNITLSAGQDINATAAYVNTDKALTAAATRDININAAQQQSAYDAEVYTSKSGMLSSSSRHVKDKKQSTQSIGTTFSGDTVQLTAGNDINVTGSNIVGTNNVTAVAGNNINVTTSQDTSSQSYSKDQTKSGLFGSGGIGITYGNQSQGDRNQDSSTLHQGSLIGSVSGNVTMVAGKDLSIKGSDVIAEKDINLVGRNIDISHVQNEVHHAEQHETEQSGLTLSFSSPITNVATSVAQSVNRANEIDDPRLKNLYAAKAASSVWTNFDTMKNEAKQIASGDKENMGSVSVNLSVGSSQSKSTSEKQLNYAQGSQIRAGGNLNLIASGEASDPNQGNISISGSQLAANNMALVASNDILIQSAQNSQSNRTENDSSGWSAGVGISLGKQTGFTFSASGHQGDGNQNGNGTQQINSQLNAKNQFTIVSGRDATLQGAALSGKKITADVGRNLTITSFQDTGDYRSRQQNISGGASFTYGSGGGSASLSASQSKTDADYASVNQQSGFHAGDGGFNITVGNHTQLNGGIISSTAKPDDNSFSTGSLSAINITNHKNIDSQADSVGVGTRGSALYEMSKSALGALAANANEHGSESSQTNATISNGKIEIRNGDTTVSDTLNRDIKTANNTLENYNVQKIAQETQNSSEAGQIVADIAGQFVDKAHESLFGGGKKLYRVVCKQEPCTYDPNIQSDPNRKDAEKNPNVVMMELSDKEVNNMSEAERKGVVVATNGILNDVQRAGELALQNADVLDKSITATTGDSKPDILLANSPHSGNFISEGIVAGYEIFLAPLLGYSNADYLEADNLEKFNIDATALGHSRGSAVVNNALQILADRGIKNDSLKVQVKGPVVTQERITAAANQLRTSDKVAERNRPEYSAFPNDPFPTFIGRSKNGDPLSSFLEIYGVITSPNSAHSCGGTGIAGCEKIEKSYSYGGLNPADLQKLRQEQVNRWLKQGTLYTPVINPVNGLLPSPIYFQKSPIWGGGVAPVAPQFSIDERVNQLRTLRQE